MRLAAATDLSIAGLLISGRRQQLAFVLMGIWLTTVAATKSLNLMF